jgi:hypothetical protein
MIVIAKMTLLKISNNRPMCIAINNHITYYSLLSNIQYSNSYTLIHLLIFLINHTSTLTIIYSSKNAERE